MKRFVHIIALNILVLISTFALASNEEVINKETQLNIYPNPVMSGQEIKVEMEVSEHNLVHIYVFDFAGKLVMESTNLRVGFGQDMIQQDIIIDDKGLYLIKIISENEDTHFKQTKVKKLYVI